MSGWATLSLSRHISSILTSSFLSISASSFSSSSGVNDFPSVHSVWSRIPSTIGFFFFVFVLIVFQSHWLFPLLFSQVEDLEELVASPLFRLLTPTWRQSEPPQFGSCCNSSSSNALTVGSGSTLKRSLQCSGSHAWREFYGRCLIHGRLSGAACWFSTPLWGIPFVSEVWLVFFLNKQGQICVCMSCKEWGWARKSTSRQGYLKHFVWERWTRSTGKLTWHSLSLTHSLVCVSVCLSVSFSTVLREIRQRKISLAKCQVNTFGFLFGIEEPGRNVDRGTWIIEMITRRRGRRLARSTRKRRSQVSELQPQNFSFFQRASCSLQSANWITPQKAPTKKFPRHVRFNVDPGNAGGALFKEIQRVQK